MAEGTRPAAGAGPRAILFDLDGTLIDSLPGIEATCRAAVAEAAPDLVLPPLAGRIGPPIREVLREALGDPEDLAAIVAAFRRRYDADGWRTATPFPGADATLRALHGRGIALYVVTNKPRAPVALILAEHGWDALITEAVSPDTAAPPHPDKAAAVRRLLADRALDPATTWLVGDSADDREAARANGLRFVAALYGYGGLAPGDQAGLRAIDALLAALAAAAPEGPP